MGMSRKSGMRFTGNVVGAPAFPDDG